MRKLLATKGPLPFDEIFQLVQPAGKYAVRSAIQKGRERKDITMEDGRYALVSK